MMTNNAFREPGRARKMKPLNISILLLLCVACSMIAVVSAENVTCQVHQCDHSKSEVHILGESGDPRGSVYDYAIPAAYLTGSDSIEVVVQATFCTGCNPNDENSPSGRYVAITVKNQTGFVLGQQTLVCNPGNWPLGSLIQKNFHFSGLNLGLGDTIIVEADIYCSWCGNWYPAPVTIEISEPPPGIYFDKDKYTEILEGVTITLRDGRLNTDPNVQETAKAVIYSSHYEDGDLIQDSFYLYDLVEQGFDSPIFENEAPFFFSRNYMKNFLIEVSYEYPGQLRASSFTDSTLNDYADYKLCYDVTAYVDGPFLTPPYHPKQDVGVVPIYVEVKDKNQPVANAFISIVSSDKKYITSLGMTDQSGMLFVPVSITRDIDDKLAGKQIRILASTSADDLGYSDSMVLYEKTLYKPIQKIELDTPDKVRFIRLIQIKNILLHNLLNPTFFGYLRDLWTGHLPLSDWVFLLSEWAQNNYIPVEGDVHVLKIYEYTRPGVNPAYTIEFNVYSVFAHKEFKDLYWFRDEDAKKFGGIERVKDAIYIYMRSPAAVYITDPEGKHAGYDPVNMTLVDEFPAFMSNPGDEPFMVFIPMPIEGEYIIEVIGTGNGTYNLDIEILDGTTYDTKIINYSSTTYPGKKDTYILEISDELDELPLSHGWNFISVPRRLATGNNTAAIFDGVNTTGRPIWYYDASTGIWQMANSGTTLQPLQAYWIYSEDFTTVTLDYSTGPEVPSQKSLYAGWNAIGPGSQYPVPAEEALATIAGKWRIMLPFDNGLQMYRQPIIPGDTSAVMNPGEGYWIHMKEPGEIIGFAG